MNHAFRFLILGSFLVVAAQTVAACQAIAGIEDRTYDPKGAGPTQQCRDYCTLVQQSCVGTNAVYATEATCLGICALLPAGDPNEPAGNTVACRISQAGLAQTTNEPESYCPAAGPAGAGACGTSCESYCLLYTGACKAQDDCVDKCKGLEDTKSFDAAANYNGDTLQCRLVHTSAATVNPDEHCVHAQLRANGPCLDPDGTVPTCDSFCQLELAECTGDQTVYESKDQCLAVCAALTPGTTDDISGNTVGCRKYHSYNALLDPLTHCSHTGPGGDGHCGSSAAVAAGGSTGNCDSYCSLLQTACKSNFDAQFPSIDDCTAACVKLDGAEPNSGYSVATATGNTLQCRLLHTAEALTDAKQCAAALGGSPCK